VAIISCSFSPPPSLLPLTYFGLDRFEEGANLFYVYQDPQHPDNESFFDFVVVVRCGIRRCRYDFFPSNRRFFLLLEHFRRSSLRFLSSPSLFSILLQAIFLV
jgi:hypothetical protein